MSAKKPHEIITRDDLTNRRGQVPTDSLELDGVQFREGVALDLIVMIDDDWGIWLQPRLYRDDQDASEGYTYLDFESQRISSLTMLGRGVAVDVPALLVELFNEGEDETFRKFVLEALWRSGATVLLQNSGTEVYCEIAVPLEASTQALIGTELEPDAVDGYLKLLDASDEELLDEIDEGGGIGEGRDEERP